MPNVVIYSTRICPYCTRAKRLLTLKGVEYQELMIEGRYEDVSLGVTMFQLDLGRVQRDIHQIARRDPQLAQSLQQELVDSLSDQFFILSLLSGGLPSDVNQDLDQAWLSIPH